MTGAWLTLLAEQNPERIGRTIGEATVLIFVTAGIAKCYAISRRRNTNLKAALGLMCLLGAWFIAIVCEKVATFDDEMRLPVRMIGGLLVLSLAVAGAVLAGIGISEIRANRARYTQGMRQAVTALTFGVCLVGLCGWGVYDAMRRAGGEAEAAALAIPDQPTPGQAIRYEKFNFAFDMPARPWVKTEANKLSPDACVALLRTRPQIGFQIIAEDAAGPLNVDNEALAEIAMANLASVAVDSRVIEKRPHRVAGVDGLQVFSRAHIGPHEFTYIHWVASHGGHLYQLVTWGKPGDDGAVRAAADEMALGFRLIDPHKAAPAPPAAVAELKSHRSDRYGYSLRLRGDGWTRWKEAAQTMPTADFAAQHGNDACVAAVPVTLLGSDPSIEAIFDALVRSSTRIEPQELTDRRRADPYGMQGYLATYWRFFEGARYDYRFFVVKSRRFAYLCAGWTSNRAKLKQVEESVLSLVCDTLQPSAFETQAMADAERGRHALFFNELGLSATAAGQFGEAAALFTKSLDLRPDEVVAENVVIAYSSGGQMRDALASAERALARYPGRASLATRAAYLQAESGNEPAALSGYAKLFSRGHEDDAAMGHYLTLLAKAKRLDDAIAAAEQYQQRFNSKTVALDLAGLLGMKGEHERAAALLAARQTGGKVDAGLAIATAEHYLLATRFADAQTTAEQAIAAGEQSAQAYWVRGEAELSLKRYREAKASLEAASAKAPSDERIRTSLKYVSALLGEGDNSVIKDVIEPVAIPAALAADAPADDAAIAKLADGTGGCYLNRVTAISFVKNKEFKTTEHRVIKVLDASGVEGFNTFSFRFDPLIERIYVNRLDVRDEAGKVVASGRVADYYVTDEAGADADGVASHKKVLTIPVPGLKPGHTIDFLLTRMDARPPDALPFTQHVFLATAPTVRGALLVRGDLAGIGHEASAGVTRKEIKGGIAWTVADLPAYRYEAMQAPLPSFTPHVVIGTAAAGWAEEAKQYLSTIAELLQPDPAAHALAKRLTAGLTDDAQRVAALVRHVQAEYAYRAIAFGRRARIPLKCADVIQNRYGDCKDHSLLLQQLFTAAGYPARLALVRTGGDGLAKRFPSLDQFDHVIVYAPSIGPDGTFFDCTDKYGNLGAGAPYGLGGGDALVLDEKDSRLIPIPPYAEAGSSIASSRAITVGVDGNVAVTETLTLEGYEAMLLRANLMARDPKDRADAVGSLLDDPSLNVTLGDVRIRELEDRAKPVVLELAYTLGGRFTAHAGGLNGSVPAIIERAYLLAPRAAAATRQTPFRIETPITFRSTVTINLPEGYAIAQPPAGHTSEQRVTSVDAVDAAGQGLARGIDGPVRSGCLPRDRLPGVRSVAQARRHRAGTHARARPTSGVALIGFCADTGFWCNLPRPHEAPPTPLRLLRRPHR